MSLLADLVDTFRGPRNETLPPVPFSTPSGGFGGNLFGRRADPQERHLDLTTVESTLFSVLDLLSSTTAEVEWTLRLKSANPKPDEEMPILGPEQHLAAKLWEEPNDFMEGQELRSVVEWHYDAVGEGWIVCQYNGIGMPESFWPVRPDRMKPVTDPKKFLLGWMYTGPGSEKVPLELNEVMRIRRPHPLDPHRGIGAVQTLMLPLQTSLTAQQWIQAFYRNDATPGGMIELGGDEVMEEGDYRKLVSRWNAQHRGVNRAHRVGILEVGSYKQFEVNFKNLQFTEMRQLTRDQILEAFRIHKHMLGISEDVNRAASLAADATYGKRILKPRVKNWQKLANGPFLKTFGPQPRPVEFCPENVVPEDEEAANVERTSKASAYKTLRDAGVNPDDAATVVGLPPMRTAINEGADPTVLAALVQKIYLGVGTVVTDEEARDLLRTAGMELKSGALPNAGGE